VLNDIRIELLITPLFALTSDTETQIKMVETATKKNWKEFFLPKDKKEKPDKSKGTAPLADLERYKEWQ
jgi:hypothetical protein